MSKKTILRLGDETYVALLQPGNVYSRNTLYTGRLFRITNKKGEILGCLSTFIGNMIFSWSEILKSDPDLEERLFLRILPHIPFEAKIEDFEDAYHECIQLFLDHSETSYDKDKKLQIIKGYQSPEETVERIVFGEEIDEEKLQRDILTFLYEVHREDLHEMTHTSDLSKSLFVDEKLVSRCLEYLKDEGKVEGITTVDRGGIVHCKITTPGAKFVRNNFQQIHSGTEVIYMGDHIVTNVSGQGHVTNVKSEVSNSFNISEVHQKANQLIEKIEQDYHGANKAELLKEVAEIKELSHNEKNYPKIREIVGKVIISAANITEIVKAGTILLGALTGGGNG